MNSYRDLKVWQLGIELAKQTYSLTARFPKAEQYALADQAHRAAVSITSNIAEGHSRDSTKEFLYHLSVSRGSLAELETAMILAQEFGYIEPADCKRLTPCMDELSRMLRGLQKSVRRRLARKREAVQGPPPDTA